MNAFDLWGIKRIKSKNLVKDDEPKDIAPIDDSSRIPSSGKAKRKRACKRRFKNLKLMTVGDEGEDEQIFNEGDGLIDSDYEMDVNENDINQ